MAAPAPGTVLAGKYRVDRILGEGGMGVVVQATHIELDEPVALKFMLPEVLANDQAKERFKREARAAVKLKSPHVARVLDVGTLDNGSPFIVMEYLQGYDLANLLQHRGPLPLAEAVWYILQAIEGLAEAHALGIVHRDIKPGNLFVAYGAGGVPTVKILDFGISKADAKQNTGLTGTRAVMGSPQYMSPEQVTSARRVDARADIWALGVVLYEILVGRVPFAAESVGEVFVMVLRDPHPPIRSLRPDLPAELEMLIDRCLAKEADRRFFNVVELAQALVPFGPPDSQQIAHQVGRMLGQGTGTVAIAPAPVGGSGAAMAYRPTPAPAYGSTPPPSYPSASQASVPSVAPISKTTASAAAGEVRVSQFETQGRRGRGRLILASALLTSIAGAAALVFLMARGRGENAPAASPSEPAVAPSPAPSPSPAASPSPEPPAPSPSPVALPAVPDAGVAPAPTAAEVAEATPKSPSPSKKRERHKSPSPSPAKRTPSPSPNPDDDPYGDR